MIWDFIWKSVFIYFFVLFMMKIMGKREIGQLSLFDFVVLLMIADVAVIGIENHEYPFYYYLLPILVLVVIQKILAFILLKFPKLRAFFDGKEAVIMYNGVLNIKEMRKQAYNIDDLIVQLRLKNVSSLSKVKDIILETNGEISVFLKENPIKVTPYVRSKPSSIVTSSSVGKILNYNDKSYPFPVIVSGVINKENLKLLNVETKWLYKEINRLGYDDIKNIYYATIENGLLYIVPTND